MTDLKIIDELLVLLKRPADSWTEFENDFSIVTEAMARLRVACRSGEMELITLAIGKHFEETDGPMPEPRGASALERGLRFHPIVDKAREIFSAYESEDELLLEDAIDDLREYVDKIDGAKIALRNLKRR